MNNVALRGSGMDCVGNLIADGIIRPMKIDGELYGSLVDLMAVFGADNRQAQSRKHPFNPRSYWNDAKKALLAKDNELSESVRRLRLPAPDGKKRLTDVAPLWACVFIVLLMDTPASTEFKKRLAKFTAAEIKYRMRNVGNGYEWAADTIHQEMIDQGAMMTWGEDGYDDDQPYRKPRRT